MDKYYWQPYDWLAARWHLIWFNILRKFVPTKITCASIDLNDKAANKYATQRIEIVHFTYNDGRIR